MNNCVMVLSFNPQVVSRHVQKRGKRAAQDVSGVRNDYIVDYGLFDADKSSPHQYNMQRLDAQRYLKHEARLHRA